MIKVSRRLQAVCDLVDPGSRVCDVGCDHAFVEIRLLQEGKISSALAMDVADGPLEKARSNLELTDLSDRCEVRKSDGLKGFVPGEADTMICTGMGGILMRSILDAEPGKVGSFRRLILSPQSEIGLVREGLRKSGAAVREEIFLREEGKYYTVMQAVPGGSAVHPGWLELSDTLTSLTEEEAAALQTDPAQLGRLVRDTGFQLYAEDTFGPCILRAFLSPDEQDSETARTFYVYLADSIRARMNVMKELLLVKDSGNAAQRLQQLRGETGVLQTLLVLHTIARIRRTAQQ